MAEMQNDGLALEEEDRLPWLESAEDYGSDSSSSPMRVAMLLLLGLLALAAIVAGFYWLQGRNAGLTGDGTLIAAQEGDYKVRPADTDAKDFEGEGDASFAASEGQETNAKIATAQPVEQAVKKAPASVATAGADAALVQLGAFGSAAQADAAWSGFTRRFSAIGGMTKKITSTSRDGGTIYRLNAVAPNAATAQQLCNGIKSAGADCMVVK